MEQYADVQQLMKKEDGQNRKPIYPPTVIQAVFNGKTGASLEAILAQFNSIYVQYQGTPEATRNIIPVVMRRPGLTITYMNMESNTITERANSAVQKDNDHWGLDVNWSRVDELSLSGDISVSAKGTWIINGKDTGIKALGPKGDTGLTPWLKTIDNKLHFSYDNVTWEPCSDYIAGYFRVEGNKLQISRDKSTWENVSDFIAAWFRWSGNKIQISRDNKTWTDLSGKFADNVHIKGYVANYASLPSGAVQGDIYGVGPTYAAEDTAHTNPIYRYYVRNANTWVDNGSFTSLSAGVVQETGNSETEVMSQKAVSTKLSELGSRIRSNANNITTIEGNVDYNTLIYKNIVADENGFVSNSTRSVVLIPLLDARSILSINGCGNINAISLYSEMPNFADATGFIHRDTFPSFPYNCPLNAKYALADFTNNNLTDIDIILEDSVSFSDKVKMQCYDISKLSANIGLNIYPIYKGLILESDGSFSSSSTRSLFLIHLLGAKQLMSIDGCRVNAISWYSENPNFVDNSGFISRISIVSFPCECPNGSQFALVDFTDDSPKNISVTLSDNNSLPNKVKVLTNDINVNKENIAEISASVGTPIYSIYKGVIVDGDGSFSLNSTRSMFLIYLLGAERLLGIDGCKVNAISWYSEKPNLTDNTGFIQRDTNMSYIPRQCPANAQYALVDFTDASVNNIQVTLSPNQSLEDRVEQCEGGIKLNETRILNIASTASTGMLLKKRKSVISFIFDDGFEKDVNMKQYCDEKNIKCGFALIDEVKQRYVDYSKEGFDILAHGARPTEWTEESLRSMMEFDLQIMKAAGIECVGWVTPSSELPENLRNIVYDYFEYGYSIYKGDQISNAFISKDNKSYELWRSNMDSLTLDQCKALIDEAVANNAMLCFYSHTEITETKFKDIVDYSKLHSQVMSPTNAVRYFFAFRHNEDR